MERSRSEEISWRICFSTILWTASRLSAARPNETDTRLNNSVVRMRIATCVSPPDLCPLTPEDSAQTCSLLHARYRNEQDLRDRFQASGEASAFGYRPFSWKDRSYIPRPRSIAPRG